MAISFNEHVLITPRAQFNLILLEISTLGFAGKTIKTFSKCINKFQEVAICKSYYIHCRRRKEWTDPEPMSFT